MQEPTVALPVQAVCVRVRRRVGGCVECSGRPQVELKIFCVARLAGLLYTLLLGA